MPATHVRTFLTDLSPLGDYAAIRRRIFTGTMPASTTVEANRLFRPGAVLEVTAAT